MEWPPRDADTDEVPTFRICVVGAEDVASVLDALVEHEAVAGRPIAVERLRRLRRGGDCQILFLSAQAERADLAALPEPGETPVLTVGESDAFLRAGGMVRFRVSGGRVRLEVNDRARSRSRLKLSSKLLQLCDLVSPDGRREDGA